MRSSLPDGSVSLVFRYQEWLIGNDPVRVKFECKEVNPVKIAKLYAFRLKILEA